MNAKGSYSFIGRDSSDTAVFAVQDNGYVNIGPVSGANSNIILDGSTGVATFASTISAANYAIETSRTGSMSNIRDTDLLIVNAPVSH